PTARRRPGRSRRWLRSAAKAATSSGSIWSKAATVRPVIGWKTAGGWLRCSRREGMTGLAAGRRAARCRTAAYPYREGGLMVLFGGVVGGVLVSGRLGQQRRGENEMSNSHFTVDHVRRTTDKPFGDVTTAFERQLGRFEPDVYQALAAGGDAEGAR